MNAAEYRALGRLMRYARAQGYTYYVTSVCGATDWSWSKDGNYAVLAVPLAVGWKVTFDDGRADLWTESVQQLTDVLVAVGLLPVRFSSGYAVGRETVGEWLADEAAYEIHWYDDANDDYMISYYQPGESERALAWARRVVEDVRDLWNRAEVKQVHRSVYVTERKVIGTFTREVTR